MAIEKGDKKALNNLGFLYYKQKNYVESEKYYKLATEENDDIRITALNNLMNLYSNNEILNALGHLHGDQGVLMDFGMQFLMGGKYEEAKKYYNYAVEEGCIYGLSNIATIHELQGNINEAEKYYLKAIEKGDVKALESLGTLYENNNNYEKAEKYYKLASENNIKEASDKLDKLYEKIGKR